MALDFLKKKKVAKKKDLGSADNAVQPKAESSTTENRKAPFAVVESYKSIRTNLMFLLAQSSGNVIALSSANAAEGKSTTSINISIAFSQLGGKVLLMDGDLRRPSIHKKMKLTNEIGLSNILAGFNTVEEAVSSVNQHLDIIPAGQIPPNPSELLGSVQFRELIDSLKEKYNYIIIDTPPINVVTDALIIAPNTDGLVLVVRDGYTQNETIRRAIDAAEFANINILGAIMNGANPKGGKRYYYRKYTKKYYRYGRYYSKGYGYGGYGYGGYGYGGYGSYGYGSYGGYGGYDSNYNRNNNKND